MSVQISTGGKSNNSLAFSFVKKENEQYFLIHNVFDHLCFFHCLKYFTFVARNPHPSKHTVMPTAWEMTKMRPKEGGEKGKV